MPNEKLNPRPPAVRILKESLNNRPADLFFSPGGTEPKIREVLVGNNPVPGGGGGPPPPPPGGGGFFPPNFLARCARACP